MNSTAPRYFALIPAAGVGARMAADGPKQYLPLAGKPMLRHALDGFLSSEKISHSFVVVSAGDRQIDAVAPSHGVTVLRCGGATRMESIRNALQAMAVSVREDDWVLVHDAARPGLDRALIEKLIAEVGVHPVGGLLALPVVDTVKRAVAVAGNGSAVGSNSDGSTCHIADSIVSTTISRDGLWLAQTPQMFRYRLLCDALNAATDCAAITDDASAVEALGYAPMLVEGHPRNLKVTLPRDIRIAEMYLAAP
ncbi:MAG: 2-C-methyl-D-erythritol 4-phosphate cytidylyltransferase [Massilia sp.]|jgi:2-C-methyl-D-erythritol 4-phosphate cytidylyltransferase|nr:2-C-methyl-D-erythritol 4-phosphate cytidylyltransferase [Massilia sp.]MDB5948844.1 2-C-methyl-D-erythritol 4-phosphate cytidylyltransferase [Massilia sp.]